MIKMKKNIILFALLLFSASQGAFAQRLITGKAINGEDGLPMPGVSVVVKGTTTGMVTDKDGNFALRVPDEAIIVVSFIGFKPVQIPIGYNTQFTITLQPDAVLLGDVVVTARRNQRERVVTAMGIERDPKTLPYALSYISGDDIIKVPSSNFLDALIGKVPGAQFYKTEFGSTRIYLRGITSFGGIGPPLYVLDGIPIDRSGDIVDMINIYDIESVTVLRGANAAILYGSAGVNGAVLITTKR